MKNQVCGSCKFFSGSSCRARPPQVVMRGARGEEYPVGYWPEVETDDWCGAWRASDEEIQRVRQAIEAAQETLGE